MTGKSEDRIFFDEAKISNVQFHLVKEIEKLKTAGAMQANDLLKERMKLAKLRVYLKQGIVDMERCIVRKVNNGTPINEVHTQRASERQEAYKDVLRIVGDVEP